MEKFLYIYDEFNPGCFSSIAFYPFYGSLLFLFILFSFCVYVSLKRAAPLTTFIFMKEYRYAHVWTDPKEWCKG